MSLLGFWKLLVRYQKSSTKKNFQWTFWLTESTIFDVFWLSACHFKGGPSSPRVLMFLITMPLRELKCFHVRFYFCRKLANWNQSSLFLKNISIWWISLFFNFFSILLGAEKPCVYRILLSTVKLYFDNKTGEPKPKGVSKCKINNHRFLLTFYCLFWGGGRLL